MPDREELEPPLAERIAEVLGRICGERPPADVVLRWIHEEDDEAWNNLQDWVGMHMPAWEWAATIAIIEAAEHIATESRF